MWTRRFWISLWALTSPLLLAMGLMNAAHSNRPERPDLRVHAFPAEYLNTTIAPYLYYHGLFGQGSRIAASGIVFIGSSFAALGLSASRLSEATGQDVFNLGLASGSVGFGLDILKKNGSVARLVVSDALTIDLDVSGREREVEGNDVYQSYAAVLRIWAEFAFDWLLDPLVPRVYVRGASLSLERYLASVVLMNDWRLGGAVSLWFPTFGEVYAGDRPTPWYPRAYIDVAKESAALGYDWNLPAGQLPLSREIMIKARSLRSTLVVTIIPTALAAPHIYAKVAMRIVPKEEAPPNGSVPFLPISADGLLSFDAGHLILPSAIITTDRLLIRLRERGLVP
jgi:hypothetical protein